jgi:hypothetical protein
VLGRAAACAAVVLASCWYMALCSLGVGPLRRRGRTATRDTYVRMQPCEAG